MKNTLLLTCFLFVFTAYAQDVLKPETVRAVFGELKHKGPYLRSEILLQDQLTVSSGDGNTYEIESFRLIIVPKNGVSQKFDGKGRNLTPRMQGSLNQIVAGDRVLVETIKARKNDADLVLLPPIVLEVKAFENEGPYGPVAGADQAAIDTVLRATYGDLTDLGEAHSLEDILKQNEIRVYSKEGLDYKVTQFKMIVAYKDSPAVMKSANSNTLNERMKERVGRAKSGDRILIEGIRAKAELNGEEIRVNLSPIIITVL